MQSQREYETIQLGAYHHRHSEALCALSPPLLLFRVDLFYNGGTTLLVADSRDIRRLLMLDFVGAKALRACLKLLGDLESQCVNYRDWLGGHGSHVWCLSGVGCRCRRRIRLCLWLWRFDKRNAKALGTCFTLL
jgi:hypothetical protein